VRTRFTIAIPTHDRRETALLATRSALAQTRPPEQVLVLCDGCSDGTPDALRALGSPLVNAIELPKAPGYAYAHRNRSLELALGDAIIWLADDDLLTPDHLERIGELWDSDRFDLVQANGVVVHPDDTLEWFGSDWSLPLQRARLASANSNPMASVSLRVDVARAIGGWAVSLPRAADWDLWKRALAAGARSVRSPEPTVLHFRATGREQAWPLRVRQNAAWFARLEDPARLRDVKILLHRADIEREALVQQHIAWLKQQIESLQQYVSSLKDALETTALQLDATQLELEARCRELDESNTRAAQFDACRAAAQAESARLGVHGAAADAEVERLTTTLTRIYNGGWWRLRRRFLPLLRLVGRGG
jgi:glycosyltransferase involved in cell wall biosynthesis